mmetsp:Transcript_6793/g.17595  ORF Transcript_6793/g.17595 Transcript_6793/m.17595 type:complete len:250 (-) Transcript_6793:7-756(-)
MQPLRARHLQPAGGGGAGAVLAVPARQPQPGRRRHGVRPVPARHVPGRGRAGRLRAVPGRRDARAAGRRERRRVRVRLRPLRHAYPGLHLCLLRCLPARHRVRRAAPGAAQAGGGGAVGGPRGQRHRAGLPAARVVRVPSHGGRRRERRLRARLRRRRLPHVRGGQLQDQQRRLRQLLALHVGAVRAGGLRAAGAHPRHQQAVQPAVLRLHQHPGDRGPGQRGPDAAEPRLAALHPGLLPTHQPLCAQV